MASQNNDVKFEIKTENRNNSYLLWDGELKIKFQDGDEDVTLLVEIFHKDDSKGGEKQPVIPSPSNLQKVSTFLCQGLLLFLLNSIQWLFLVANQAID